MFDETKELDTIMIEHRYLSVGDPVPANKFDQHDLHIAKHNERLAELDESADSVIKQAEINMLKAHIRLHEEIKQSI